MSPGRVNGTIKKKRALVVRLDRSKAGWRWEGEEELEQNER